MLNISRALLMLALLACSPTPAQGLFSSKKESKPLISLPFLGAAQELSFAEQLEKKLDQQKKAFENSIKTINKNLTLVNHELAQTQAKIKKTQDESFDYINKKISILTARKQLLTNHQELWKEFITLIESHIALLKNKIEFQLNVEKQKPNPVYSWSDFKAAQTKYAENTAALESHAKKLDALKKQIGIEKEHITFAQKQLDNRQKEQERLTQDATTSTSHAESVITIRQKSDILTQEIAQLEEKIDYTKLKIEKLTFDEKYQEDELSFLHTKLQQEKMLLDTIEKRLMLDIKDVEIAKTDWTEETKKAIQQKEKFTKEQEEKISEKEQLSLDLAFVREKLKTLQAEIDIESNGEARLAQSNAQRIETNIQRIEKELLLINSKKDQIDISVKTKEMHYLMIDLRYRLRQEDATFDELLSSFKNKYDTEAVLLKSFKDKRFESIHSLIENKRTSEDIKQKTAVLKDQKIEQKIEQPILHAIIKNYNEIRKELVQTTQITQDFLAVCEDIILQQENVLKSYTLIINDLESRKMIQSIWKRSPQAISFKAFLIGLSEAEVIAKKFFWDTPAHISPSALISTIKNLSAKDLFSCLLFFLLFFALFALMRFIVWITHYKSSQLIQKKTTQTKTLYYNIFNAITSFASEHFTSIFSLLFIYAHLVFNFRFIFNLLKAYASPYNIALFHLISIPILVYLSGALLTELKELNKRLSYLFFTENFQERFLTLLSFIFYSTALILPLKAAFTTYSGGHPISFPSILMAGYSLFVLVVILLFFNKEDVLTIIPQGTQFTIWLKRKIEKYYYPVFGFIMSLLILSNHSIGYSNLAWFLAFAVPLSLGILYLLFLIHHYIRQYSVFLFMIEDEDEIRDKYEHAKTYYGFFVIVSFLALLFVTVIALARIWGLNVSPLDLWNLLSNTWVIELGSGNKLGFVQFVTLVMFIIGGFLTSSLVYKFILNKLFDILRTEPGLQNTITRVLHYLIIGVAIILGMVTIHIDYYIILTVGGMLTVGLGLALKEILTDFVGGFLILLERPIEIGNYIQIDSLRGTVHKISARTTTIVTSKNHSIIVPNRELLSKILINWGRGRFAVGFEVDVRVCHETDPDLVKKLLLGIAQNNSTILRVPSSIVRLEAFEENALYFFLRVFISARRVKDQWEVASQLRNEIIKTFKEHNVKLAWPHHHVDINANISPDKNPLSIKFKGDVS
ncbi:MAG: hypothetical protein US69_C0013G0022 [candidate division TM6 bacterium GW2011_GWF2_38_10]|nr:MAG: hypothetical protein US69_C0013G0022 [candidate division TM6 bacterium GW2011_GWF2_38_10]